MLVEEQEPNKLNAEQLRIAGSSNLESGAT